KDYDCRAKWMAIAALARQESPDAVPVLVSLVDHGNQNTRFWARAALARMAKDDFKTDKNAWNKWWVDQGHTSIDPKLLQPYKPPTPTGSKSCRRASGHPSGMHIMFDGCVPGGLRSALRPPATSCHPSGMEQLSPMCLNVH